MTLERPDYCAPHRDHGGFCALAEFMGCPRVNGHSLMCPRSVGEATRARTAVNLIANHEWLTWLWRNELARIVLIHVAASEDLSLPLRSWLVGYWRFRA